MTGGIGVQIWKETRALLPVWLPVMALCAAAAVMRVLSQAPALFAGFPVVLYGAGVLTIAAVPAGHELANGTLPTLLVQPRHRLKTLFVKVFVLGVALSLLAFCGAVAFTEPTVRDSVGPLLIWGPVALGLSWVPLLILATRMTLGGPVLAVTIPGILVGINLYFWPDRSGPELVQAVWRQTLGISAIGFVTLIVVFNRLQLAGNGIGRAWRSPVRDGATAEAIGVTHRQPWIWHAVKKELRLQQMTLALSALYVISCAIAWYMRQSLSENVGPAFYVMTRLQLVFIPVLAGTVASAEERQLGTLPMQVLLPRSNWKQFGVKAGVAIGVAVILAVVLPRWIQTVGPEHERLRADWTLAVFVGATTVAAIYVSSLSPNSLWALVRCFPVGVALALINTLVLEPVQRSLSRAFYKDLSAWITPAMRQSYQDDGWRILLAKERLLRNVEGVSFLVLVAGLLLLLLYLAHRNHRSLDRSAGVVVQHAGVVTLYLMAAAAAHYVVSRVAWAI